MSLDVSVISQEQVLKIFAKGEGHFSDMKSQQIQPGNLTKTLSAFANADGGELYIGIDELNSGTYQWNGFTSIEEANGHLQALEEMFPLSTNFKYSFLRCDGLSGAFLYCEIDKTADIRYASNKIAYLRRGAQNLPQDTAEKLDRLKYSKGLISFEDQIVNGEPSTISNSLATIEFALEIILTSEPDSWLRKQKLIVSDRPTVGRSHCRLGRPGPARTIRRSPEEIGFGIAVAANLAAKKDRKGTTGRRNSGYLRAG